MIFIINFSISLLNQVLQYSFPTVSKFCFPLHSHLRARNLICISLCRLSQQKMGHKQTLEWNNSRNTAERKQVELDSQTGYVNFR
jgi:hypothetical protein